MRVFHFLFVEVVAVSLFDQFSKRQASHVSNVFGKPSLALHAVGCKLIISHVMYLQMGLKLHVMLTSLQHFVATLEH